MRRFFPILLCTLSALLCTAEVQAADPIQDQIAKLVSPVPAERRAGEMWLAEQGDAVIADLIKRIEAGEPTSQAEAIETLTILVSPWQRGIAGRSRHHGQIELFRPMRPTGRPVDHPRAAELRRVLMGVLTGSLRDIHRLRAEDGDYLRLQLSGLVGAASTAVAEVADDRTARAIAGLLERETDPSLGGRLMHCLETIYGLPTFYQIMGICGVGMTPELLREHEKREAESFNEAKKQLLAWIDEHAGERPEKRPEEQPEKRIAAAIELWAERAATDPMYYVSRNSGGSILRLARLGEAAVPALREQQARETTLLGRGFFEAAIATITGEVDDALVRELIDAKHLADASHHQLACEIIALAGSQAYRKELAAMLGDNRYSSLEVAHTLAIVHRKDALELLRMQPASNYIAECAVKELESWEE